MPKGGNVEQAPLQQGRVLPHPVPPAEMQVGCARHAPLAQRPVPSQGVSSASGVQVRPSTHSWQTGQLAGHRGVGVVVVVCCWCFLCLRFFRLPLAGSAVRAAPAPRASRPPSRRRVSPCARRAVRASNRSVSTVTPSCRFVSGLTGTWAKNAKNANMRGWGAVGSVPLATRDAPPRTIYGSGAGRNQHP